MSLRQHALGPHFDPASAGQGRSQAVGCRGTGATTMTPSVGAARKDGDGPETCRRCELWKKATQAVVGEGPRHAPVMLVGEQPGDAEDRAGRPFVGPAGRLLHVLLAEAGIDPAAAFLTNAVKHFRFEIRGKRRLHKTPTQSELDACNLWLRKEIERARPRVIVTLGTTALRAVIGERIPIAAARERRLVSPEGTPVIATYHPSAVLRTPAAEHKDQLRRTLLGDLKRAAELVDAA